MKESRDIMAKVAVLGAGSWGTAIAFVLANNDHDTVIWARREEQVAEINEQHTNARYLKEAQLPHNLRATSDLKEAVDGADAIVLAVPTKAMRAILADLNGVVAKPTKWIHVSKGIEPDSLLRVSEVLEEVLRPELIESIVALSGPSHAEEVVEKKPTTVAVASHSLEAAQYAQDLFMNEAFRVYTNDDIVGVEIGGSLKNVIALAAGITDGMEQGDNAKAALITRGLAEMTRLGVKMGANPLTFSGLAGLGDLIVTCTSVHSRNWKTGYALGQGQTLDQIEREMGMVIEGVRTAKATYQLAKLHDVSMPITEVLYAILFEGITLDKGVQSLMGRMKKQEVTDIFDDMF